MHHRVHDHLGELPQVLLVGQAQPGWAGGAVDDAKRAQLVPPRGDQGDAGVEPYAGGAGHEAIGHEARVHEGVADYEYVLLGEDGVGAEGELARCLSDIAEPPVALEQLPSDVHQAHQTDRGVEDPARQRRDPLELLLVLGVQYRVFLELHEPLDLVLHRVGAGGGQVELGSLPVAARRGGEGREVGKGAELSPAHLGRGGVDRGRVLEGRAEGGLVHVVDGRAEARGRGGASGVLLRAARGGVSVVDGHDRSPRRYFYFVLCLRFPRGPRARPLN
mmetsp:Transcript_4459/g.9643  ORF Transcript_4459/g.9643 Transcript_4459/m.9643 type:complete len:276 (-) Transcript_4459:58-885(-)